jgi:xanthine dehydrogenase YagS FAD-binding subunit
VAAKVDGNKLSQARIVLGAVSNIPYQVEAANTFLEGKELSEENSGKAADLIFEKAHVQPFNGYKIPIARALIHRTLTKLTA